MKKFIIWREILPQRKWKTHTNNTRSEHSEMRGERWNEEIYYLEKNITQRKWKTHTNNTRSEQNQCKISLFHLSPRIIWFCSLLVLLVCVFHFLWVIWISSKLQNFFISSLSRASHLVLFTPRVISVCLS